jgi:hypothetical protein
MRQAMREARRLMDAGARGKPAVDPGADTPLVTSVEFDDRAQELMPQSS